MMRLRRCVRRQPALTATRRHSLTAAPIASAIVLAGAIGAPTGGAAEAGNDYFESKIRPLLVEHCYECHSEEAGEASGDFRVDTADAIRSGGGLGPAVVPGNADESLLLTAVRYRRSDLQMPPQGKLSDEEIHALQRWIEMGAPDPRTRQQDAPDAGQSTSPLERDPESHWAFVPPRRAEPPDRVDDGSHDVVDALAAEKARQANVKVAPEASRETLIRRLYFDLTGLPPNVSEIQRFVSSDQPDAYTRLVDRLLASPAFGERFGRHWLDVARYADTVGYTTAGRERRLVGSERFRDWTIRAFGSDMPYDAMIMHQLAGDRTDPANQAGNLDAMGFLTVGRRFLNRHDIIDDRIDVITRGLLGLTVTCARCHDHKFDPIPTADYYSLYGMLQSSVMPGGEPSPLRMVDRKNPRDSRVFRRGQPSSPGEIAPRQYLTALRSDDDKLFRDGSGRFELAKAIASADNPLTARVMVNRIWGRLVGQPLVQSPSDFGFRTRPPAVSGVLDDLSADFARHWSVKRLVRRIVRTRIYRQSVTASDEAVSRDPDNQLLARANRRRRDFESLRDSMLIAANWLDRTVGGEPVEITSGTPAPRRTIYAMIDRQNLPALFRTFDFASPDTHSPKRYFTTVPQQALHLLNNQRSFALARKVAWEATRDARQQLQREDERAAIVYLFRRILRRQPSAEELEQFAAFVRQPVAEFSPPIDPRTLWSYGTISVNDGTPQKFTPFRVFSNGRWQANEDFPSPDRFGHASLTKEDGHPGKRPDTSVCRRWRAPASGTVKITGMLGHRNKQGDGIDAEIWVGDKRLFGGNQKSNNRPYGPLKARVKAGETIDFVASPGDSSAFDGFFWRTQISLTGTDGNRYAADSVRDFSGPVDERTQQPLTRLEQAAQVLLMSNEFAFVD